MSQKKLNAFNFFFFQFFFYKNFSIFLEFSRIMSVLSPKNLLSRLLSISPNANGVEFQVFRGIANDDGINHPHNYCYAVCFLQLFFHCEDVITYFRNETPKNESELFLKNIYKELYKKTSYNAIYIIDFILNWSGWEGGTHIPNIQCDICEFANFLLNSLSTELSDLFLFTGNFINEVFAPFDRNYIFYTPPCGNNIEEILQIAQKNVEGFQILPKYLMISINRHNFNDYNDNYIGINTFIKIKQTVYKHIATAVFAGQDTAGHYKCFIKIKDEYFLFDDNNVSALFYYNKCNSSLRTFINHCNDEMNTRSCLIIYKEFSGDFIPSTFEHITYNVPHSILPGSQPLAQMINTLKSINNAKTKENNQNKTNDSQNKVSENQDKTTETHEKITEIQDKATETRNKTAKKNYKIYNKKQKKTSIHSMNISNSEDLFFVDPENESQSIQNLMPSKDQDLTSSYMISAPSSPNISQQNLHSKSMHSEPSTPIIKNKTWKNKQQEPFVWPANNYLFKNICEYKHDFLPRIFINVKKLHSTNLSGAMKISIEGIPPVQQRRTSKSLYAPVRSLFKFAGRILRNLKYNDQGRLNAEILGGRLKIDNEKCMAIKEAGDMLYDIFTNILTNGNITFEYVECELAPIIEWYLTNFGEKFVDIHNQDIIVNDNLNKNLFDPLISNNKGLSKKELNKYIDSIVEEEDEDDDDYKENYSGSKIHLLDFPIESCEINEDTMQSAINNFEDEFDDLFYYFAKKKDQKIVNINCFIIQS